jgi:hypothetical protein
MPVEEDIRHIIGGNIFLYEMLEHLLGHTRFPAAVYLRLIEIIAVMAPEIAKRAHRLYHYIESLRARDFYGVLKGQCILQISH